MGSKWLSNSGSTDRVKSLLEHAGVPLELQVANISANFCNSHAQQKGIHFSSNRVVYSNSMVEQTYREIDQEVRIYEEMEISKLIGISLAISMPIECKYRKDMEVFAIPNNESTVHRCFPLHSELQGSRYFSSLIKTFSHLSLLETMNIETIEIKGGETPQKIHEENLIYNAAGALYDYIQFWLKDSQHSSDEIIDDIGLFDEFQSYLKSTNYYWLTVIRKWLEQIDENKHKLFDQKYFNDHRIYQGIYAFLL